MYDEEGNLISSTDKTGQEIEGHQIKPNYYNPKYATKAKQDETFEMYKTYSGNSGTHRAQGTIALIYRVETLEQRIQKLEALLVNKEVTQVLEDHLAPPKTKRKSKAKKPVRKSKKVQSKRKPYKPTA